MEKEILDQNPGIPTLDRALAPLLGGAASAPAPAPTPTPAPAPAPAPPPAPAPAPTPTPAPAPMLLSPAVTRAATPPKASGTPPTRGATVDAAALAKLTALVERLEGDAKAKYGYVPPPTPAARPTAPRKGPGGPPPPPPPGPPPNLADLDDKRGGKPAAANTGALFAELNKGSDVTVGLKKATKQKAASSKVLANTQSKIYPALL